MEKLKSYTGITLFILILLASTGQSLYMYIQAQKEIKRHVSNQIELVSQVKYFKDKSGKEVAKTKLLEYTIGEFKKIFPAQAAEIKEMKIKPGRVESFSEMSITQAKTIITPLRDTIIIYQTVQEPAQLINYKDTWYTVSGIIGNDTARLQISSLDTLIQVVSRRERRQPWKWFFSPRMLEQNIRMSNPANKVIYSRFIKID